MKITHVLSSIDKTSGGTSTYMKLLIESLSGKLKQKLITFNSEEDILINADFDNNYTEKSFISSFYSKRIKKILIKNKTDLYHGNGLWQVPVNSMCSIARKRKVHYIISPHGMLEDWSLKQGSLKKKIALKLFQYKDLQNAVCIHATSDMERNSIRNLGFKNPIAIIPNGIDLREFKKNRTLKTAKKNNILFLSRIHPKKGIENLIDAWSLIKKEKREGWTIDIFGSGEASYIAFLGTKIKEKKLEFEIFIKEPVYGKEKFSEFREAKLFVLPTYSENFGIVIAEALASRVPVITTEGTPWEDLHTYNCGWWIKIGVEPLKLALEDAIDKNDIELNRMGLNGESLIEKKYSMDQVGRQMLVLYKWILNNTEKPDFIDTI
jgi:glycosyltransferase involved in cell wall biosynthesis